MAKTKYFITQQLPPEMSEEKKILQPIYKDAKLHGKRARYVGKGNVVMVDDVKHEVAKIQQTTASISDILHNYKNMDIHTTQYITMKDNHFIAHIAAASTTQEISMAVSANKHANNRGVSSATHNMFAARIQTDNRISEYVEDDGEFGGAKVILQELQSSNIVNRVVVCSRWSNGHLGAKRFDMIR